MAITKGTNILFKYGTQKKYEDLATKDSGTFYVTSDTNRLYLGNQLLSQAIRAVANLAAANTEIANQSGNKVGQIYYLQDTNVLAVYNGTGWQQLNPDSYVDAVSYEASTVTGGVSLDLSVDQHTGVSGKSSFEQSVQVKGSKGITVKKDATVTADNTTGLIIEGSEIGAKAVTGGAAVTLDDDEVAFKGGTGISVSYDSTGKNIKIDNTAVDKYISSGTMATDALAAGGFSIGAELTRSGDNQTVEVTSDTIDPIIKLDKNASVPGDGEYHFLSGIATLPVYNKSEIDALIKDTKDKLDAVTYKGILTPSSGVATLPTTGVAIGDMWMLGADAKVNGKDYKAGNIFIAGSDNNNETNGVITGTVVWDSVQTSDTDTTYSLTVDSGKVVLDPSVGTTSSSLAFAKGTDNKIGAALAEGANNNITVTLSHAAPTFNNTTDTKVGSVDTTTANKALADFTQSVGQDSNVTVIAGVAKDSTGHVTSVSTQKLVLKDTKVTDLDMDVTAANNVATIKTTISQNNSVADVQANENKGITIESTTLSVAANATANGVVMNLVWDIL